MFYCDETDVIVTVDGSSQILDVNAFRIINSVMDERKVWFVWSQEITRNRDKSSETRQIKGASGDYPGLVKKASLFRDFRFQVDGLQAFYGTLFSKINRDDPEIDASLISEEMMYSIPMLEMAREKVFFIPEVLYYDDHSPIQNLNDEQRKELDKIPKYKGLDVLVPSLTIQS